MTNSSNTPLRYVLRPVERTGFPDATVLSVYRDHGVIRKDSRSDNHNKTPADLSRYQLVQHHDLVVNKMKAWQGSLGISGHEGIVSPDYLVCKLTPNTHPRFLHHLLRSGPLIGEFKSRSKGIRPAQWRLYWDDLAQVSVTLPDLDEQCRIAHFLDAETARIDHLRSRFSRQRSLLDERESTSLPLTVAGARLDDESVNTGLGWLPAMHPRAQLVPLIRLLQLQRGADLSEDQRRKGSVPVVTTAGLAGWHDVALSEGPGVVIGRYGSVGNVHWVETPYWPHNTTLYVKNFNGNDPRYCYHVLRSLPYEMEQARAAVPGVNRNDLHRQKVALLPQDLQRRVVMQLDTDAERLESTQKRIKRAESLLIERRQALITAAVTGQFDVSTASGLNVTDGVHP
ncbi:hypothetical protein ACF1BU_38275 [Streptomyces sp. NPDC014724]|uniref:hypothetical protein n=1 Tax=unclassified Streptomyces TaxID=2593676 RepID=UPI0036FE4D44